jgi:hypothetical protein
MGWLIVPALVGAVVLFVVNSICWMALKHHMSDFKQMPNRDAVEAALKGIPPGGFYCAPHPADFGHDCKDPRMAARYMAGPNVSIVASRPGPMMAGSVFVYGFLLNVVEAVSLVCILHAMTGVTDTVHAVAYAAMLGALVRGVGPVSQANWMKHPWPYAWKVIGDGVLAYALAAVVIRLIG